MRNLLSALALVTACRNGAPPPGPSPSPLTPTPSDAAVPAEAAPPATLSATPTGPIGAGAAAEAPPVTLVRGPRVVSVEHGEIVTWRDAGAPLTLGPVRHDPAVKLSATVGRFLGRPELVHVVVGERTEQGWHYSDRETHYVIDTSGPDETLACRFVGNERSGGEYASQSTSVEIKRGAASTRTFDVVRTTTSRTSSMAPQREGSQTQRTTDRFELGVDACMKP